MTLPAAKPKARSKNPKLNRLLTSVERFATRMGDEVIDQLHKMIMGYEVDPSTFPNVSGLSKPPVNRSIPPMKTTRPQKRQFEPEWQCNLCFQYEAPRNDETEQDEWLECPTCKEWAHLVCIKRAGEDMICANCGKHYYPKRRRSQPSTSNQ